MKNNTKIKLDNLKVSELLDQISDGRIRLPNFQRTFVWDINQIIKLLDSLYHQFPVGSFLFWSTDEDIASFRKIGKLELSHDDKRNVDFVLDGQQRITSLFASLKGIEIKHKKNGKESSRKVDIYFDLDEAKFLSNPFENDSEEEHPKYVTLRTLPEKKDYNDFMKNFLSAINQNDWNKEDAKNCLSEKFGINSGRRTSIINQTIRMRLLRKEGVFLRLTEDGLLLLTESDSDIVLKSLIENVSLVDEILRDFLKQEENTINALQIFKFLEEELELEEKRNLTSIRTRFNWFEGLKLGVRKSDDFVFSTEGRQRIDTILKKIDDSRLEEKKDRKANKQRYICVTDIIDTSRSREISRQLSDHRKRWDTWGSLQDHLSHYEFSVIRIVNQPIEIACEIFERINNSGKVLDVVDLIVAKSWSKEFNLRENLEKFRKRLSSSKYEKIPDITIIQCLSAIVKGKVCRKDILEVTSAEASSHWIKTEEAIIKSIDFLKETLKIKDLKLLPYNAVIVPLSYFFDRIVSDRNPESHEKLKEWFWKTCLTGRFDMAADTKISEEIIHMSKLIKDEDLDGISEENFPSFDRVLNQKLNMGSALCKTILCALNYKEPKEFKDGSPVSFSNLSKYNSTELHHIFPVAYLRKNQKECHPKRDIIANIAFAKAWANKEYSDKPPSIYLNTQKDRDNIFDSHLITEKCKQSLLDNNFEEFTETRANEIYNWLSDLAGESLEIDAKMRKSKDEPIDEYEKNIRTIIKKVLMKKSGDRWEDNFAVNIQSKILESINEKVKKNPGTKRGDYHPLECLGGFHYFQIIKNNWEVFEAGFGSKSSLENATKNVSEYRNAIKHGRNPTEIEKSYAKAGLTYFKSVFKYYGLI